MTVIANGDTFGELGVLINSPRTANVVAVSDLECIVIKKEDFMKILEKYSTVGIKLSKLLARYLAELDQKLSLQDKKIRLILLFQSASECGGTTLAHTISASLAEKTLQNTIYTEYPHAGKLINKFQINEGVNIISTYSTEEDLNLHLDSVIDYIKEIGVELKQEAMALARG